MDLPKRDANSSDPVIYPFSNQPRSASNSFDVSEWLRWRMTDPDLPDDLREMMEVEIVEAECLGKLLQALDRADGETMEDKLKVPEQRDALKALSLRWLRSQAAVIEVTTAMVDHRAGGNGH